MKRAALPAERILRNFLEFVVAEKLQSTIQRHIEDAPAIYPLRAMLERLDLTSNIFESRPEFTSSSIVISMITVLADGLKLIEF